MRTDWEVLVYNSDKEIIDVYYIYNTLEAVALELAKKFIAENHGNANWGMYEIDADF